MLNYYLIQSLALVALAVFALSFHAKTRTKILIINTSSLLIWALHFFLLHAWTGTVLICGNATVSIFFIFKDRYSWIKSTLFLYSSLTALTLLALLSWQGFFSIFALIGIFFIIIAKWQDKIKDIKTLAIFASLAWIVYDFFAGAYGSIISETIIIVSILVSFFNTKYSVKHSSEVKKISQL